MRVVKSLIYFVVFFLSVNICFCQDMAILTGKSIGLKENDRVRLISNYGYTDSTFINNSSFKFRIPVTKASFYTLAFPDEHRVMNFFVFIKEHSKINIELDSTLSHPELTGDQLAMDQNDFWKGAKSVSKKDRIIEKEIGQTKDSLKTIELNTELEKEKIKIANYAINWVEEHRSCPFSTMVIYWNIAKINPVKEDTLAEKCFDDLLPVAKENNIGSDFLENLFSKYSDKYNNNLFIKEIDRNSIIYLNDKNYSKVPLGSIAPDFSIKDTLGRVANLSDFKNKYVLIDFWASWCGPCRRNNPTLKDIYNQYKAKGLRVLSVSVDKDPKNWKKAIREDKMNWTQGSDLIGPKSLPAVRYGVTAYPTYILLDPTGKIILKSEGDIDFVSEKMKKIL